MSTTEMDREKQAEFLGKMTSIMNGGALALMCSIGHKTGLFDTMSKMDHATSADIADSHSRT